jgi:hypothetical protein
VTAIYLRDRKKRTLVDIEIHSSASGDVEDVQSFVAIVPYSELLLSNQFDAEMIIDYFRRLSELRGWFFEFYCGINPNPEHRKTIDAIKRRCEEIVVNFDLSWVED